MNGTSLSSVLDTELISVMESIGSVRPTSHRVTRRIFSTSGSDLAADSGGGAAVTVVAVGLLVELVA